MLTDAGSAILVAHLTTVHPPFDTRIFHKQAKTLAGAGYQVVLIAPHERDEEVEGIRVVGLAKPPNRLVRIVVLSWQAFRLARRERADVYHFHDPELLPIGLMLKLSTRAKVIYDVHEDVPKQVLRKHWLPYPLRRPVSLLFTCWQRTAVRVLDAVVVATEAIAETFESREPVVLKNYPRLGMMPGHRSTDPEHMKESIVYVGGISRSRGAVEMIQAVAQLDHRPELQLVLIGQMESLELGRELENLPGFARVRLLGWLEPREVYRHLTTARIGLVCLHPVPRYVVALPVKLFEYMAAGLPVIASDFPLWREIVEGNECGLCVDPLKADEIADAIEYLLQRPEEARRMGENGRRAVEEKYNWETEAKKLLSLYEKLLAK